MIPCSTAISVVLVLLLTFSNYTDGRKKLEVEGGRKRLVGGEGEASGRGGGGGGWGGGDGGV